MESSLRNTWRFPKRWRGWIGCIAAPIAAVLIFLVGVAGWHRIVISSYDVAVSKLKIGDGHDRIIAVMGQPHEKSSSQFKNADEYVYRVYHPLIGESPIVRTQWRIVVDRGKGMTAVSRSDNGC